MVNTTVRGRLVLGFYRPVNHIQSPPDEIVRGDRDGDGSDNNDDNLHHDDNG